MTFRTEVRHECSSPAFSFRNPSAEIGAPLAQEQQRPLGAAWLSALPEGVGFVGCLSPRPPRVGPRMSRPRDATTARLAATHGRIDPLPLGPHPGAFRSLGRPTTLRSLSIGSQRPVAPSLRGRSVRTARQCLRRGCWRWRWRWRQVRCAPWAVPFGSAAAALGRQGSNDRAGEIPRQGWSYWPLLMHNNPVMDRPGSAQLSGLRRPRGFRQASAEQTDTTITHQLSGYGCAADPEQIKCYKQHTISHSECLSPICWGF
jgi:hypothetical protein